MSTNVSTNSLAQMLISIGADLAVVDQLLPRKVQDLAEKVGYAHAFQVVAALGGTTWAIPLYSARKGAASTQARAKLARALGSTELGALVRRHYQGETMYVPRCEDALRGLRDMTIHRIVENGLRNDRGMGAMVKELAIKFSLSDRRIWEILKQPTSKLQLSVNTQTTEALQHG